MKGIEINDRNKETIFEVLGKCVDSEGYIMEKRTKERVICPYSKTPIHSSSFSIMPGSFIFINNYSYCFTEHIAKHGV